MGRAAAGLTLLLTMTACVADPTSNASRAPGHAARTVEVSGDGVTGVRAAVVSWRRIANNALPPGRSIDVRVRLTADRPITLAGTTIELAVCAVTARRVVVLCGSVTSSVNDPPTNPTTRVLQAQLETENGTSSVATVLVLPDQRSPSHVPRSVDPKDGGDYVAPAFPIPGDHLR